MRNINRREFIGGALAGSAALLAPQSARAADARVEILLGEQLGTVANPHALVPTDGEVKAGGPTFVCRFAPASVTRLQMSLA